MKINFRRKLIIAFDSSSLWLLLRRGREVEDSEKILLRETPEEILKDRVGEFLKKKKVSETLLLLPRSEVLAKELVLAPKEGSSLKESLQAKLEEILPYSPKEMAFGLSDGLLLALPEKKLKEMLLFLERLGLIPDEITTEDQALAWLLLERKERGPLLLLDKTEERILALFFSEGRTLFSRAFPRKGLEEASFFPDLLEELSLSFIERGRKPERILLSGSFDAQGESEILQHFSLPAGRFEIPQNGILSSCLHGALLFGKHPFISLLPKEAKIKKWERERRKLLRDTLASFILFLGAVFLAFQMHVQGLENRERKLTKELRELSGDLSEIKKLSSSLAFLAKARSSKEKTLALLKDLSLKLPSGVRLRELAVGGHELSFKGESPSHGLLSETVDVLEKIDSLEGARLHETRLRKRLNEDYFEFEVAAKWTG